MNRQGLIVARHRRDAVIESAAGETQRALVRGRKLRPVTGDEVMWHQEADGTVVIESILPRRTLLERIDSRGRAEGVAANITALVVVLAPRPIPDWSLADRYLVAAELLGVEAIIVHNKIDIEDADIDRRCESYARIGYPVIRTSARQDSGIAELKRILRAQRAVLVGQSGVGKSSLLNALIGNEAQAVGRLSERREIGRHTTTAAMLYRLPAGSELIDSPGVRRYSPSLSDPSDLAWGFRDLRPYISRCRFNDCSHEQEPGCAVMAALQNGEIEEARYASYLALRSTLQTLARD